MAAATAPREAAKKAGEIISYPLAAATKIYKGTLVFVTAAGYAIPARTGTATDVFVGVAAETQDNTAGAAGALSLLVEKTGTFVLGKATAAQTDVGIAFYAADDNNVTATSTGAQLVGYGVAPVTASTLRIRINPAVK